MLKKKKCLFYTEEILFYEYPFISQNEETNVNFEIHKFVKRHTKVITLSFVVATIIFINTT